MRGERGGVQCLSGLGIDSLGTGEFVSDPKEKNGMKKRHSHRWNGVDHVEDNRSTIV
mgnify:FL=1|jgi:hypothetical protein